MYYTSTSSRRRLWLAASGTLAALLILLLVIFAAYRARSDEAAAAQGPTRPSATPSVEPTAEPTPTPTETEQPDGAGLGPGGTGGSNGGTDSGGGNQGSSGGGDQGGDGDGDQDGEEPEPEPVAPLSIAATIGAVTPNGHCSASGTITVEGGEYPVTVKFQWRALAIGQGWDGVAVSPVQSHTFEEPGGISIQTNQLPEDGTNVFLVVSSPKETGSGLVGYDGCSGQGGGGGIIIDS